MLFVIVAAGEVHPQPFVIVAAGEVHPQPHIFMFGKENKLDFAW
jgi:hypothetical protein